MYAEYTVTSLNAADEAYSFNAPCSLFGCNVGWIPRLLRRELSPGQGEPYQWHVPVRERMRAESRALVIDLKPINVRPPLLTLFELEDVWGVSDSGWTPMMLRLRALFVDEDPDTRNARQFRRSDLTRSDVVHTFLYAQGSIADGRIVGKWIPPRASPTNSALLWPRVWDYFRDQLALSDA